MGPFENSHLSVDWQNPIDWTHHLNRDCVAWLLTVPHFQGGDVLKDLAKRRDLTLDSLMSRSLSWETNTRERWGSLRYDGSNDFASYDYGGPFAFDAADSFTYCCWVRTTSTGRGMLFGDFEIVSKSALALELYTGGKLRQWVDTTAGGRKDYRTGVTFNNGLWRHVGMTWDAGTLLLYIDGVDVNTTKTTDTTPLGQMNHPTLGFKVGKDNRASPVFFDGEIDDFRCMRGAVWTETEFQEYIELSQRGYPGMLRRWIVTSGVIEQAAPAGGRVMSSLVGGGGLVGKGGIAGQGGGLAA